MSGYWALFGIFFFNILKLQSQLVHKKTIHNNSAKNFKKFSNIKLQNRGYIGEKIESLIESMPWVPCQLFVLRVCLGIFGIVWYQEYALVSLVSFGILGILRYPLIYNLVSLVFFCIKSLHWYYWNPMVTRECLGIFVSLLYPLIFSRLRLKF